MASVTLENVFKIYPGGVTAVNDVNLEVKDKEFLVLVGPVRLRQERRRCA
jgi:multiple sugar transport system ATP-binding protein